ncbi:hypothetical protein JCM3766R1_000364 [Sporobolomyces carnicolor]
MSLSSTPSYECLPRHLGVTASTERTQTGLVGGALPQASDSASRYPSSPVNTPADEDSSRSNHVQAENTFTEAGDSDATQAEEEAVVRAPGSVKEREFLNQESPESAEALARANGAQHQSSVDSSPSRPDGGGARSSSPPRNDEASPPRRRPRSLPVHDASAFPSSLSDPGSSNEAAAATSTTTSLSILRTPRGQFAPRSPDGPGSARLKESALRTVHKLRHEAEEETPLPSSELEALKASSVL